MLTKPKFKLGYYHRKVEKRYRQRYELLDAFGALGVGLYCRKMCGVLSGAVCAMAAALHGDPVHRDMQQDLVKWFEERYGSTECKDLLGNQNCTQLVDETVEQCRIMLESYLQDTFE